MRGLVPATIPILVLLLLTACSQPFNDPVSLNFDNTPLLKESDVEPCFITWGVYDMVIARDGSSCSVAPNRTAEAYWGYHLNAVKLLEVSPGKNCIRIEKIEVLPEGNLAVDISITHPYNHPCYTGFDVRGIIMFPSSQYVYDDEWRAKVGWEPYFRWFYRYADSGQGDAELINTDGYTGIFARDDNANMQWGDYYLEEGFPIFGYYEGVLATGDDLGNINGYKNYYSNETRHMFEVNETVTRTFVIHPPSEGNIEAAYAVYAHWVEPSVLPVTDPASDFPPEANSPCPYTFWVEQTGPIDLDAPGEVNAGNIQWHMEFWDTVPGAPGPETSDGMICDLIDHTAHYSFDEAFDVCPDCYQVHWFGTMYGHVPDLLPASLPFLFELNVDHPDSSRNLTTEWSIVLIDIEPLDGEW